jgi:hypothetical protein
MAKKIYDIIPPKIVHQIEGGIKNLMADAQRKKHRKETHHPRKKRGFPLKEVLIGVLVLAIILAGFLYFKLQKAEIEIWPKTETLSFEEQITADKSVGSIDPINKVIPSQYLEEEKEIWQDFPATGNVLKEGKAEGTIKIYNKYNNPPSSLTLKKGTHFLSDSGKYFITLQKITVPAAQIKSGKLVPGSIETKVVAAESGKDYNIGPAEFSVPKLAGTPYYYSIYAKSTDSMTGGFTSQVKQVTDDDIQKAKDFLTKKLLDDAESSLKKKISSAKNSVSGESDSILLESAILREIVDASSVVKSGAIVDSFNYQAKVRVGGLIFKKSDLEKFAKAYILSKISDSKTFLEKSLSINYSPKTVDIREGKITLDLGFSAKIYQTIDKNDLISLFREKSASEIKETVNRDLEGQVSQIKVNFWPFWVTKTPRDKNKIKVDLMFE